MAEVVLRNVEKRFGRIQALRGVTLEVRHGEFLVLLGPTGAGKTTTLRIVSGLEEPDRGDVLIDGVRVNGVAPRDRNCAFVFQNYILYPHLTVYDNLAFPLRSRIWRVEESEIQKRVAHVARVLKIEHLLERKPDKLSGGEQQRVALGRAMVRSPKIFLMDEPLSNLDAKLREEMRVELKSLQKSLGATFFFVTHDHVEAMTLGDRVAVLNQGVVQQVGMPEEVYDHPANIFVARFVGNPEINLLEGYLEGEKLFLESLSLSLELQEIWEGRELPSRVLVGVRPENILLGQDGAFGEVYLVEDLGADKIVRLRVGEALLRVRVPKEHEFSVGEKVPFSLVQEKLLFFDPVTEKCLG
ncbi:MAG: ABC transporter ATP-binding protein [Candidatus Caldatribacteriaceae bacterium]